MQLAVDDFGTGYSSLRYLQEFPIDVVKLDMSFIERVDRDEKGAALVRGVIDLTHALGLIAVAEGVERLDQLDVLRRLHTDMAQGFCIAHPAAAEALDLHVPQEP